MRIRSYSELIRLGSFMERYRYLKLDSTKSAETFGLDRYLKQRLYHSKEWEPVRNRVIVRDCGCDLGMSDREIHGRIYIHHMNPVMLKDLIDFNEDVLNPEYLICTMRSTHDAIHYGDEMLLVVDPVVRKPNDTCPWKH